jgi:divalent metal cation (Fe/Co/Zn/Cd) transporter
MGPDFILVNLSVDFAEGISSTDVENTVVQLDQKIKEAFPEVKRIFVEAEARRTNRARKSSASSTSKERLFR